MVRTESTFLFSVGATAPDFSLPEPKTGNTVSLKDATLDNGVLVVFMCNHCPYVQWISQELIKLGNDLPSEFNVGMVGISSSDVDAYPVDGPDAIKESEYNTFHYLFDENQDAAKAYGASCTPDFFLLDKEGKVFYRGQLDNSRPGSDRPVTGEHVRSAAALLAAGKDPPPTQKRAIGCNIKWKPGNEPNYAPS